MIHESVVNLMSHIAQTSVIPGKLSHIELLADIDNAVEFGLAVSFDTSAEQLRIPLTFVLVYSPEVFLVSFQYCAV